VTNPYGAICTANSDPIFNYKCTPDNTNCLNPSLWAIYVDTAAAQTFAWDSSERYFLVAMSGGASFYYDLISDAVSGLKCT
jgi:hypothetical protein